MKLAEIILARSVWLLDLYALNPRGLAFHPLHKGIIERYQFLTYPSGPEQFDENKGVIYQNGTFVTKEGALWVSFQVWSNGLIADTRSSTKYSDAFLEDLLGWVKQQFGVNYYQGLVKSQTYTSQITVYVDFELTNICEKLAAFAERLAVFEPAGTSVPELLSAIVFRPDHKSPFTFTFERRENTPFSENKYFSLAALPTERHIELLNEFERILTT